MGSSVARARQATFPNDFFDKSTEDGGLSLFYLIIILQIDIILTCDKIATSGVKNLKKSGFG